LNFFNKRFKQEKIDKLKNVKKRKNVAGIKHVKPLITSMPLHFFELLEA